jgi:hypothetical protein
MLTRVVLPAPLGPISAWTLPASIVIVTARSAVIPPKFFSMPFTVMIGAPPDGAAIATGSASEIRDRASRRFPAAPDRPPLRVGAKIPATPRGRKNKVTRMITAKMINRNRSASCKNSGSSVRKAAPISGPIKVPAPPNSMVSKKKIELTNGTLGCPSSA